jgi:Ca-activated chloride channel family protein
MREEALLAQLPEGKYPASVIVLLTDGENNQSIQPLKAAQAAAERGVRVDALGFGTTAGTTIEIDGFSIHTALDEATLQETTEAAGGTYYPAQREQDLKQVYASLTPQLVVKPEAMEITSILAGAGIVILLVGSLFSLLWFNRLL